MDLELKGCLLKIKYILREDAELYRVFKNFLAALQEVMVRKLSVSNGGEIDREKIGRLQADMGELGINDTWA